MTRTLVKVAVVVVVLVLIGGAGYAVVHARAAGGGTTLPTVAPSLIATTSPGAAAHSPAPVPRWQVAKAVGPVVARTHPSAGAPVRATFGRLNASGYASLFLVRRIRQVGGTTWYDVWLPVRPNGSHGWVREGSVAIFPTSARIVIDLSARRLTVYRYGLRMGSFPVAVGSSQLPTPTGHFYIDEKLRPSSPGGPYGVLAIGISAFQPRLPNWPLGGPVAIHGTNQPELIGQAVSHGCVRMHNRDVLKVSAWVTSGSPVDIVP